MNGLAPAVLALALVATACGGGDGLADRVAGTGGEVREIGADAADAAEAVTARLGPEDGFDAVAFALERSYPALKVVDAAIAGSLDGDGTIVGTVAPGEPVGAIVLPDQTEGSIGSVRLVASRGGGCPNAREAPVLAGTIRCMATNMIQRGLPGATGDHAAAYVLLTLSLDSGYDLVQIVETLLLGGEFSFSGLCLTLLRDDEVVAPRLPDPRSPCQRALIAAAPPDADEDEDGPDDDEDAPDQDAPVVAPTEPVTFRGTGEVLQLINSERIDGRCHQKDLPLTFTIYPDTASIVGTLDLDHRGFEDFGGRDGTTNPGCGGGPTRQDVRGSLTEGGQLIEISYSTANAIGRYDPKRIVGESGPNTVGGDQPEFTLTTTTRFDFDVTVCEQCPPIRP